MTTPAETAASLPPLEALAALNAEATALRQRLAEVERVRALTVTYLASMDDEVDDEVEVEVPDGTDTATDEITVNTIGAEPAADITTREIITETIGADAHERLLELLAPHRDHGTTNVTDMDIEAFRLGMRSPKSRTRTLCAAFQAWACSEPMMTLTDPDIRDVVTRLAMFMAPGASTVEVRRLIDGTMTTGAAA
ncbi:hypothetical protein [Mycolicibacter arupensis]|uniref:Uncharacterized protein n=1 Tax=Mycolicibacter arupensis TaxID=342002 RepID=A0A5C7Y2R3_9MYCO|nr:hypothetical protein [Mycolicibacter arupensis]TXI55911.1 MAG: hypothetical protein E6Q54_11830 [Mycolicibacter arupensis]